jgi:hypothetical protein
VSRIARGSKGTLCVLYVPKYPKQVSSEEILRRAELTGQVRDLSSGVVTRERPGSSPLSVRLVGHRPVPTLYRFE